MWHIWYGSLHYVQIMFGTETFERLSRKKFNAFILTDKSSSSIDEEHGKFSACKWDSCLSLSLALSLSFSRSRCVCVRPPLLPSLPWIMYIICFISNHHSISFWNKSNAKTWYFMIHDKKYENLLSTLILGNSKFSFLYGLCGI